VRVFNAEWKRDGKQAGPFRNALMLNTYPQAMVLAFPLEGPGTWGCIKLAKQKRMVVRVFDPFGEYQPGGWKQGELF